MSSSTRPLILGVVAVLIVGVGIWYVTRDTEPVADVVATTQREVSDTDSVPPPQATPTEVPDVDTDTPSSTTDMPTPLSDVQEVTPATPSTPAPVTTPTPTPPPPAVKDTVYQNGVYSANGQYRSPEGTETIGITLTIKDDMITNATGIIQARDKKSVKYQQIFLDNFKTLVVGKKLSDVSLGKVSGASLTPKGFNDAVAKIKTEAAV